MYKLQSLCEYYCEKCYEGMKPKQQNSSTKRLCESGKVHSIENVQYPPCVSPILSATYTSHETIVGIADGLMQHNMR